LSKRQSKRVTLEDIAQKAGVSAMTVSRVLNNKGEISDSTRNKISEIIQEMDYRPSRVARSLATNQTFTVGVMVSDIVNPYFAYIVSGAQATAWGNDYNLLLYNTQEDPERERVCMRLLEDTQVDGVLICSTRLNDEELITFVEKQQAVVIVNRAISSDLASAIWIDDALGSKKAVSHCIDLGRTQLGIIAGPKASLSANLRLQAYIDLQKEHGYLHNLERVVHTTPDSDGGYQATIDLLTKHPSINGLICYNDLIAIGALEACRSLKRSVPDDIAIVGYDDIAFASHVYPPLTTLQINPKLLGHMAMDMLIERIQGKIHREETIIEPELIIRNSTVR
jgi:LacI family transcriptional regulator